ATSSYRSVFFSSRRRHTRCYRDWSSDVCSSDLSSAGLREATNIHSKGASAKMSSSARNISQGACFRALLTAGPPPAPRRPALPRSEERRVGKECRARGTPSEYRRRKARVVKAEE